MGCDIHFFTERLTKDNNYQGPKDTQKEREDSISEILDDNEKIERWVSADEWEREKDWDNEDDENATTWAVASSFYSGRNYHLFDVLAGVRGGLDSNRISEPKGIPETVSSGYQFQLDRWHGDDHSHSYFTLKELLEIDWSKYNCGEYDGWLNDFLETIEHMKDIDDDAEKVRCVFFFDN